MPSLIKNHENFTKNHENFIPRPKFSPLVTLPHVSITFNSSGRAKRAAKQRKKKFRAPAARGKKEIIILYYRKGKTPALATKIGPNSAPHHAKPIPG